VTPAAPSTPAAPTPAPAEETPIADSEAAPEESEVQGESEAGGDEGQEEQEATPVAAPSPTEASGAELPFTGINAWWMGALGLTAAGIGIALRRRSSA
jgi:hypothetical protein